MKSGTTFDGGVKAYNGSTETSNFAYGDTITVKVTPKATGIAARSFTPPTINQMALFVGTKQITVPVIAIAGVYTMTYDTKGKDLAIGSNTITAKYVGNESMADYSDTVTVTLNKKAITSATVSTGATKAYDGTGSYTGVALTPNATDLGGDTVTATADGTVADANVGATKAFTATSVTLDGKDAGYYTLAADKVSGKVAITAKSVSATDKNDTRNIVQGTGTFAEPSIDSGVGSEKVTGTIAYSYNGKTTYADVMTELAKLANGTTASVGYTLTAIGNYIGTITGTLTMTVVDLNFTTTGALKFKTNPTYGDLWSGILIYDSSKLSATLNGTAVAGTFTFKVDSNAFNATAVPKAGTFAYQVTFTATSDSKFKDVAVLSGNVTVAQREASLSWNNTELTYNGNVLKPTATVSNKVTGDDVAVTVSGEQTSAGDSHTATASILTGTSAANYKLPTVNTTTYKIKAAAATGNVTLSSTDTNSNRKLDNGDTVTADISAVAPAGGTVSYQWKKTTNGTTSNLGTNASYALTASDTKGKIFCMVTFTGNVTGTKESNKLDIAKELLAGTISITGNNTIGSALTVSIPTNTTITAADYTIAWYRGDVVIAGATATSYTLTKNDLGKTIKVVITAKETSEDFTGALTSNEATVPATAAEKPVITATADNGYVTVNWTKPFDNGSTITGYTLTVKQGATEINGSPFIIGTDATSYKVANLTNGTAYSFVLTAINGIGNTTSDVKTVTPTQPSSGGGSVVIIPPTPTENDPTPPTKSEIIAPATVDKKGNARITVTDKMVTDAIKKAQAEAKKNGIAIELKVDTGNKTPNSISVNLSKMGLDTLVGENVEEFKISSPLADLTFDSKTLQEILKQTGGDVTINVSRADVSKLSKKARKEIGNRPVFNLSITDKDGKIISDFGGGSVTVSIPYTLQPGENPNNVQAYFVDGKGKLHQVTSTYDPVTKCLIFVTNHFSIYGIGYKEKAPKFKDIKKHWAKSDIEFVTARGLLSGKNKTKFSPNTAMTRGMFVTALGRLAGVNVRGYKKSSFTDIKSTDYFMGYVEWANKNGIVKGTSATTFSPNAAITRQEMAVIMKNYAKTMNYTLPKTRTAVTFADNANIASWAADEVKSMQMAGVIMGKDGNRFDPTSSITRAEASAVLRRYIELVIDKATAQGLDRNDSGKFVYYENGKLFTGTKTINGTTYHFGNDGICIKIEP
ncbi:MAG: S-layer homology domain-containing protein [Lachnospiraceae bacterium]